MILSKSAKRVMIFAMSSALFFSSMFVAPSLQAATSDTPSVSLLGATLRLDGNSGYQSMRVGVKINNASKAKDCGINFTLGDTTLSVSTQDAKYNKIYSYDSSTDTVVYTAIIKDIPAASYDTSIKVQGLVTDINTTTEKNSGSAVPKSIGGIVRELQVLDSSIKLDENGDLVKVINDTNVPLEADDPIFKLGPMPRVNLDLSDFDAGGFKKESNASGGIDITYTSNYAGKGINIPSIYSNYKAVSVNVSSTKDGSELEGGNQIVFFDTEGKEIITKYGKGVISIIIPDGKTLGKIVCNAQEVTTDTSPVVPQVMSIKSISLSTIDKLDLSTITIADGSTLKMEDDGSATIACAGTYTGKITIDIPSEVAFYASSVIVGLDASPKNSGAVILHFADGTNETKYNWGAETYDDTTFNCNGKVPTKITLNNQDDGNSFNVKYIEVAY